MNSTIKASFNQVMTPAVGMSSQEMHDYLQALSSMLLERQYTALCILDEQVEILVTDVDEELMEHARFFC